MLTESGALLFLSIAVPLFLLTMAIGGFSDHSKTRRSPSRRIHLD